MKWTCLFVVFAALLFSGCVSVLPSAKGTTKNPWNSFEEARDAYDKVVPKSTTVKQLRSLGFNIYSSPNLKTWNYIDIAMATQSIRPEETAGGIDTCIKAREKCRGYEFEPRALKDERYGNVLLDILNFRRKTRQTGWRFKAVFFVIDDIVVEKIWSGSPYISEDREIKNPLGPLQEPAGLIFKFF